MIEKIKDIYTITNILNGKYYVGSSLNVRKRLAGHLKALRSNQHHSDHLQRAWNKYGENNFKFEIVLILNDSDEQIIRAIEQEILDKEYDQTYNTSKYAIITANQWAERNHNFGKKIYTSRKSGADVLFNKKSNKWRACISIDNKTIHLGCFETYKEALKVRLEAEKKYWAEDYVHIKKPVCVPLNYRKKGNRFEVNLEHNGKLHYKTLKTELEAYEYVMNLRKQLGIVY